MKPSSRITNGKTGYEYGKHDDRNAPAALAAREMKDRERAASKTRLDAAIERKTSGARDAPSREHLAHLVATGNAQDAGQLIGTCPRHAACTLLCQLAEAGDLGGLPARARTRAIERAVKLVDKGMVPGPGAAAIKEKVAAIARQWGVEPPRD